MHVLYPRLLLVFRDAVEDVSIGRAHELEQVEEICSGRDQELEEEVTRKGRMGCTLSGLVDVIEDHLGEPDGVDERVGLGFSLESRLEKDVAEHEVMVRLALALLARGIGLFHRTFPYE